MQMKRDAVKSQIVKSIGYDHEAKTLEIEFKNGTVWQYYDYQESEWEKFNNAESKGLFFHTEIKDKYVYKRVY